MSTPTTFEGWMAKAEEYVKQIETKDEDELDSEATIELATQAADAFEKAHALKSDDSHCLYQWGRTLFTLAEFVDIEEEGVEEKMEQLDKAIEKLEQAEKLSPDNADILYHLGQALTIKGGVLIDELDDTETGAPLLRKSIEFYERAYPLREQQIAAGAVDAKGEAYTASHLVDIISAIAESITSIACIETEVDKANAKFDEAFARLEKALPMVPDRKAELLQEWADALQIKANYLQDQQTTLDCSLFDPAVAKLEEAIAANTTRTESIIDLAELYLTMANSVLAQATLGELDEEEDEEEDEKRVRAMIDARVAKVESDIISYYDKATAQFERALKVDPENSSLHGYLADAIFGRSQLHLPSNKDKETELVAQAEKIYRTALSLEKERDESALQLRLAQALFYLKREDECVAVVEEWKKKEDYMMALYEADDVLERDFLNFVLEREEDDEDDDDNYEDVEE
jgi:tetratricopeptide (TPR) repeat protein